MKEILRNPYKFGEAFLHKPIILAFYPHIVYNSAYKRAINGYMNDFIRVLNENQGVIAVVAVVITIIGGAITLLFKKEKAHVNSPYIKTGHGVAAGGDIIVGGSKISHSAQSSGAVPEIHLQLYGAGSKRTIEGHVEKKDNQTLVLESVEINGKKTDFDLQFTKLTYIKNLNYSDDLFTTKNPKIEVKVSYRSLTGEKYMLYQKMIQTGRADGLFNVSLTGSPHIKNVDLKGNISSLEKIVLEKLYKDYKETGTKTKWKATEAYKELGIKDGQDVSTLTDSEFVEVVLEGTHECFIIANKGIRYMDNQ